MGVRRCFQSCCWQPAPRQLDSYCRRSTPGRPEFSAAARAVQVASVAHRTGVLSARYLRWDPRPIGRHIRAAGCCRPRLYGSSAFRVLKHARYRQPGRLASWCVGRHRAGIYWRRTPTGRRSGCWPPSCGFRAARGAGLGGSLTRVVEAARLAPAAQGLRAAPCWFGRRGRQPGVAADPAPAAHRDPWPPDEKSTLLSGR